MKWSKRRGNIVSKDMLRDKRASRLRSEEKCSGQRGSVRSELGELLLVYFGKYRQAKYEMAIVHRHHGETTISDMADQLNTIFTCLEIR